VIPKIAIIGLGNVGSTIAYSLINNISAEILLVDVNVHKCKGELLDLSDAVQNSSTTLRMASFPEAAQADIIIISAGKPQLIGQSRTDLLKTNSSVITSIINSLKPINPHAILIMVTNPVDIMTHSALKASGLAASQVFGSGTLLDTIRLQNILANTFNCSRTQVATYVLGEHGDSQFPVWSQTTISGKSITNLGLTQPQLDELAASTREQAYEIIRCKGATYYGVASCVTTYCKAIVNDSKTNIPVSCFIERFNLCLSMPALIGRRGIEKIIELPLNAQEIALLEKSVQTLFEFEKSV
jgi:L-lactate dehydrogenase